MFGRHQEAIWQENRGLQVQQVYSVTKAVFVLGEEERNNVGFMGVSHRLHST